MCATGSSIMMVVSQGDEEYVLALERP